MKVERLAHIEGRGYVIGVKTEHAEVQVLVSEKGRSVTAWQPGVGKLQPRPSATPEREAKP